MSALPAPLFAVHPTSQVEFSRGYPRGKALGRDCECKDECLCTECECEDEMDEDEMDEDQVCDCLPQCDCDGACVCERCECAECQEKRREELCSAAEEIWEAGELVRYVNDPAEGFDEDFDAMWGEEVRQFEVSCQNHNVLRWSNLRQVVLHQFAQHRNQFAGLPRVTAEMLETNRDHVYCVLYFCYVCFWASGSVDANLHERFVHSFPSDHPYLLIPSVYFPLVRPNDEPSDERNAPFWAPFQQLFENMQGLPKNPQEEGQGMEVDL
jgi:hypothetical protein